MDTTRNQSQDIPIIYCRLILAIASRDVSEPDVLLQGTGLRARELEAGAAGISVAQYRQLLANVTGALGRRDAMLGVGARIPIAAHGAIGRAFIHSPNWQTGLEMMERFIAMRGRFIRMRLIEHPDCVQASIYLDASMGDMTEPAYDFIFGIFTAFRNAWPLPLTPLKVELTRPASNAQAALAQLLECEVRFGCESNSMYFRKHEIAAQSPLHDDSEFRGAVEECRAMLGTFNPPADLRASIRDVFQRNRGVICTIDKVAASLHVSQRKLQRQLAEIGCTYQQVLDEWLKDLAVECLVKNGLSAELTAVMLGYSDASTYRRAFRRWFGMPPSELVRHYHVRESSDLMYNSQSNVHEDPRPALLTTEQA